MNSDPYTFTFEDGRDAVAASGADRRSGMAEVKPIGLSLPAAGDITDRNRTLEELTVSEVRYRRLFEAARDGILLLDVETGKITDANPFMVELLGYPREELLDKELWEIGLFGDKSSSQAAFDSLQSVGYIRYEDLPLESKDGHKRDVEFVSNVYREGDSNVIQCNIRDITARKQMERVLARQQADLSVLNERLQAAMTEAHHRIKNNLQIVAAMLDLELMVGPEMIPSATLQRISVSIRAMGKVHDILTEHTKEDPRSNTVPASDLIDALLGVVRNSMPGATIHGEIAEKSLPIGQITSIALVLTELVHNAIKHGSGEVWVTFLADATMTRLVVRDDGPGFSEGFDAERDGNTGLQLVHRLVRWDLGGQIRFSNRPEGGAAVEVSIS